MKNKIFHTYGGGKGNFLNDELVEKIDTEFNVNDVVEVTISESYYNQPNAHSTVFKGTITEIGYLTYERHDKYYKFNIFGIPFELEDKYIKFMSKVGDGYC